MPDLFIRYLSETFLRDTRCEAFSLRVAFTEVHAVLEVFVIQSCLDEVLDANNSSNVQSFELFLHMRSNGLVE